MFQVFLGLTPFIGITLIGYILGYIKIFDLQKARIFNLFSFCGASPFNLLVALCSANFLFSKSDEGEAAGLIKLFGFKFFLLTNLRKLKILKNHWI